MSGRALAAALVLAALPLSACSLLWPPPADDRASCDWMTDGTGVVADETPRRAVLLDVSASTAGLAYQEALIPDVREMARAGAVVSIGVFDGTAATVRWVHRDLATRSPRVNLGNQRDDQQAAEACLAQRLTESGAELPREPGTDVLGALTVGGEQLGSTGERRLLVATDGLATTGCAALTRVAEIGADTAERVAALCRTTGELPDALAGVDVEFLGLGHPADDRPQPSTGQLRYVGDLWEGLCHEARAKTCDTSTGPVESTTAGPVPAAVEDDPVLVFPPVRDTIFPVDPEVLFGPNDDAITDAGEVVLADLAGSIAGLGAGSVVVYGYSEARSSPEDNLGLATRRATAVRDRLVALGVAVVAAEGSAGSAPGCPRAAADAPSDDPARQCSRRVDIVFQPS